MQKAEEVEREEVSLPLYNQSRTMRIIGLNNLFCFSSCSLNTTPRATYGLHGNASSLSHRW